ncbi:MAG: YHYH protein [Mycobacterium sp.]|nr:YHYH protein [Mycobacterium sp.]
MKRRNACAFGGIITAALLAGDLISPSTAAFASDDTTTAIESAAWNPAVSITFSPGEAHLETNDIPNHPRDEYYAVPDDGVIVPTASSAHVAKDPTREQAWRFTIPTNPQYSTNVTSAPLGSIGVMISGAVLFNPYEGDANTVAMASNFTITDASGITASFVDACAGHPTPLEGAYHYHGLPNCVASEVDSPTGPSHIIGFALDGFPIYGARDIDGSPVPVEFLDQCNGIDSPTTEFPAGIYHYVLPGTFDSTSSIKCFHGIVDVSQIMPMPPMAGPPTDSTAQSSPTP